MALMPEITIEPLGFGQTDDDRVKEMYKDMFLLEYAHSRKSSELDYDEALSYADEAAKGSADYYRAWLKQATK